MKKVIMTIYWAFKIALGCLIFGLGFALFLEPNGLNAGGISGLAMVFVTLCPIATVGTITALANFPLFLVGGKKIGMEFFIGSILGTIFFSLAIDLCAFIPIPETEPLLAALYGGILCGGGLGLVIACNASTGGSDIIVRLLKQKNRNVPIGQITLAMDVLVAALTGIVFGDISNMLYTLITVYVSSLVIDAVVYRFDYSKVALIISRDYEAVAHAISTELDRGVTLLYGQGYYSKADTKVILVAVKQRQMTELKDVVVRVDPNAFIIVQEAHQVLGDGFARHSKDSL